MKTVLFIILIIFIGVCHAQMLTSLTSSLSTEYAYPEQTIMFRCVVINSPILAWSSPDYIGQDGVLIEFLSVDHPGSREISSVDSNTVATLSSVIDGEHTIIESNLRVVASSQFQISSVVCHNVGQGIANSTTFEVLDLPAQEVNSSGLSACPGDKLTFTCETRDSPILAWRSDQYIGVNGVQLEILSADHLGIRLASVMNTSTVAELTDIRSNNGSLILVSQLSIIVLPSIVQHDHTITCSNVGIGTERSITFQLADTCEKVMPSTTTSVSKKTVTTSDLQSLDYDDSLFISKAYTVTIPCNGLLLLSFFIFINLISPDI